jgi:cytoskeletal protein CcmA (bactofilin family)
MIGPTIKISGDISGEENLAIEGKVEGTINLKGHDLSVGQSGEVRADITASVVRIDGEVTGDISGMEKVVVSKNGRVKGNIVAPRVTLEDGAKFKGSIDMDPAESSSVAAGPKPAAKAAAANSDSPQAGKAAG